MMSKKPVLTISILCSGRAETEKCLASLKTLRERVPCELILVDTGCGEEMRQVLFRYADEVVPFVWCNDFAKARNAGADRAKGEWFLYLDDDERFIDTRAIEDFFLAGEYRNYGYAAYTVRNFSDEKLESYQDAPVVRLYSMTKRGRFQGAVHEHFEPLFEPAKILDAIAEHTGYIFRTPEDKVKHSMRNVELLEKAVSEKNDDAGGAGDMMRLRAHLAWEYFILQDYKKLIGFCRETLQKFKKQDDRDCNRHRGCFYGGEILAEIFLEEYGAAFQAYMQAVQDKRNTGYTTAYLMTQGAELYSKRGEKEKVDACCRRYLELWEYYKDKPDRLFAEQSFFVMTAFYDETRSRMYSYRVSLDLEKGETASLRKYFDRFGWEKPQVCMTEEFIPCLVRAMARLPYEEIFGHAANVLVNKPGMDIFWEEIEKIEEEAELFGMAGVFSEMTEGTGKKAAAKLKKMLKAEKADDWDAFSAALKEAVGECPMLGGMLKRYAAAYAERRMGKKEQGVSAQIQALAAGIKAQIPVLLSQGMKKEALQVLEQLQSLTPQDGEIAMLKESISKGM